MPAPVLIWLVTGIVVALLMRRTALGLLIEAIGINRAASALAGVNARVLLVAVYMASGSAPRWRGSSPPPTSAAPMPTMPGSGSSSTRSSPW